MSPLVLLCGCVALAAAFVFSHVCAYMLGTYQGWRKFLRTITPHEQKSLTFQDGDTLVAVVERRKGKNFFLGTKTQQNSPWEE